MQPGQAHTESGLSERLARLETALGYERQTTQQHLHHLHWRLMSLEARPPPSPSPPQRLLPDYAAAVKVGVAIGLPLIVLLLTGSVEKAVSFAKIAGP